MQVASNSAHEALRIVLQHELQLRIREFESYIPDRELATMVSLRKSLHTEFGGDFLTRGLNPHGDANGAIRSDALHMSPATLSGYERLLFLLRNVRRMHSCNVM